MKDDRKFKDRYGPWALIAGGSRGIGAAFARRLAERGLNLVLISRGKRDLDAAGRILSKRYSVSVRPVRLDLRKEDFLDLLAERVKGLDIGLLVYNATFPSIGKFLDRPLRDHLDLLAVNCRSQISLIHHFATKMKEREKSGIVMMSSLTAFCGTPWLSHYGASKAYTLVLGEGLARELKGNGTDILVCCPGATRTENYVASLPKGRKIAGIPVMEPDAVAEAALKSLGKRDVVIPGILNRLTSFLMQRILGRRISVSLMSSTAEKLYAGREPRRNR